MISATTPLIALVVYLVVVPVVKSHHLSLNAIEERLRSESLFPPGAIAAQAASGGLSRGGSFRQPSSPAPSML